MNIMILLTIMRLMLVVTMTTGDDTDSEPGIMMKIVVAMMAIMTMTQIL